MRRTRSIPASVLLLLVAGGCAIGTRASSWRPANQAAGTEIELDLRSNRVIKGELLAVDSSSFVVLEPTRIVRVGFEAVRNGGAYKTGFGGPAIDAKTRDRLRLMSRYPQGLSPAIIQDLLQAYGFAGAEEEF
jgi:small nuclear ribonucleoprotein (snRNP)-like protein